MYVVQKRDAQTLVPLIKKNALPGCDIHSDEWRACGKRKTYAACWMLMGGQQKKSLIQYVVKAAHC